MSFTDLTKEAEMCGFCEAVSLLVFFPNSLVTIPGFANLLQSQRKSSFAFLKKTGANEWTAP